MKQETIQAIEDIKHWWEQPEANEYETDELKKKYEHALTLAIEEIEEKDKIITILRGELDFKDPNDYIEYFLPKKEASK